jgi:TRAP-type C4-dicarboxylate transport system substrate-binding protein
MFSVSAAAAALATATTRSFPAGAAAGTTLKAVANHRRGASWAERWPWLVEQVNKRSNGSFQLEATSVPELGLTGTEIPRLLRASTIDMADVVVGYVSGELPMLEAIQLPSVFKGTDEIRKVHDRWLPEVVAKQEQIMGGKVYGIGDYSTSFLVTKFPVNSLDDIKGKKIRIFAASQADMLGALGAQTLSVPSAEMYSALERGVIDGVVTGPDQIFGQKMNEVAGHVTDLQLGDSPFYTVISKASWARLSPEQRKLMEDLQPEFTERGWKSVAMNNKEGLDYARDKGMKVTIPSKTEWQGQLTQIGRDVVAAKWAKRVGPNGVSVFNEIIGPVVGFKIA